MAQVVAFAALGVYAVIAGPFWLAPICWATATVLHWRRGMSVLDSLRNVPDAKPIMDALYPAEIPTATVVSPRKPQNG